MKTTEIGGLAGYDAGKKIKGRKRHIVTDTLGLMLFVLVHGADVQDRDGAPALLKAILHRFPWLRHIFADGGYAGEKLRAALHGQGVWTLEIISCDSERQSAAEHPAQGSEGFVGCGARSLRPERISASLVLLALQTPPGAFLERFRNSWDEQGQA